MHSLRSIAARGARTSICRQCLRHNSIPASRTFSLLAKTPRQPQFSLRSLSFSQPISGRNYSAKTSADYLIEDIQEQYGTARDEFEIAAEETEKKTVYAADDRAAAREELDKLKAMYEEALGGPDGEEIKGRVGQRIRELDNAVLAMEKNATED
jgi:hypothetical protein